MVIFGHTLSWILIFIFRRKCRINSPKKRNIVFRNERLFGISPSAQKFEDTGDINTPLCISVAVYICTSVTGAIIAQVIRTICISDATCVAQCIVCLIITVFLQLWISVWGFIFREEHLCNMRVIARSKKLCIESWKKEEKNIESWIQLLDYAIPAAHAITVTTVKNGGRVTGVCSDLPSRHSYLTSDTLVTGMAVAALYLPCWFCQGCRL